MFKAIATYFIPAALTIAAVASLPMFDAMARGSQDLTVTEGNYQARPSPGFTLAYYDTRDQRDQRDQRGYSVDHS
jgi:hypothetical protein